MRRIVEVLVKNRTTYLLGYYPKKRLEKFFSFHPPNYYHMPAYQMGRWDGLIKMLKRGSIPTGLFLARLKQAEKKLNLKFDITYEIIKPRFKDTVASDRPYQIRCVKEMQKACRRGGGLILAATGVGKTRMTALLFQSLIGKACFVVDELTLLEQAKAELGKITREEIGQIGRRQFNPKRITVVTIQTLHKHRHKPRFKKWARSLQIMVIDEVHLAINRRQTTTLLALKPIAVLGLTATLPLTEKHIRLQAFAIAGPVAFRYSLKTGESQGYLTKGVVIQVRVKHPRTPPLDEWNLEYFQNVVTFKPRNDLIAELAKAAWKKGRHVVILVEWIKHIVDLHRRLKDIPHYIICGMVDVVDRVKFKKIFNSGKIRLIITNRVFKKGIDIPIVDCIVDGAGLKSITDCIQKYGRGVRLCKGKEGLVYFDVGDTGTETFEVASNLRSREFIKHGIPVFTTEYNPKKIEAVVTKAIQKSKTYATKR